MHGQQARKDTAAAQAQRTQDKESKRARGALSCAECRRLKLKCDKTVPCSSCKRRGCSAICPNGSLTTGQGTRFVLADTEKLHQKIAVMSDRIRLLEDALAILQSTQSRDTHPLLQRDLLKIKSIIELHAAGEGDEGQQTKEEEPEESQTIDAFGTLAIRDDGAATFYGRSAGQESLLIGEETSTSAPSPPQTQTPEASGWSPNHVDLPASINNLSSAFPFSPPHASSPPMSIPLPQVMDLNTLVNNYLPPWPEALRLSNLYMDQAPWFFGAVTRRQLEEEVLPMWYSEAPRSAIETIPLAQTPHDLALLFILFTFGAKTDAAQQASNPLVDTYYTLTKAALSLAPVLERPPSVATVQTLALMGIFEGMNGGENAIEATWALMGLATKLAQSVGLHRDCARWQLPPAEVQKRRALFWELFITDCWQSLATGRLATFSLPFVDCELPSDPEQTMTNDGTVQPSFPYWKARFGAECVAGVVQGTLTSRAPKYSIILELDRKVRDMELPAYAQGAPPQGVGLAQTMSHFMPINYRELTLLYIHRCFFAHAIASHPTDPIRSQYAPSFLAGYRSACTIIGSVRQQFAMFPAQIARFWVLWTHAFSAAVMLSSVVTHSSSKVAPAALLELNAACELFHQASIYGGRAAKFLPILQRLQSKAQKTFMDTSNGIPPSVPGDIFKPTPPGGERKDELSIFSGKTHTLTTKSSAVRSSTSGSTATSSSSGSPRSVSDSPHSQSQPFIPVDNPSFAGVHPSLVMELRGFDGKIAAQIRDAYSTNNGGIRSEGSQDSISRQQLLQAQQEQAQRIEREREHMERQKLERQQMERQQMERQKMERQRIEEHQRLFQEQEQRRLQEEEQYRQQQALQEQQRLQQQLEMDRQRQQQQHHYQQYQTSGVHPAPTTTPHHHSRSDSGQRHSYIQSEQDIQHRPSPPQQQQHSMYAVPAEYHTSVPSQPPVVSAAHYTIDEQTYSSSYAQKRQSTDHHGAQPMASNYSGHQHYATVPISHTQQSTQQHAYHWEPNSEAYVSMAHAVQGQAQTLTQHQHQHQHYTPDGALRGIAADDRSLQETWQSYMYKVGSPRHLFED